MTPAPADLETFLREAVARRLRVPSSEVDPRRSLASFGVRSIDMMGILGEIEAHLQRELSATLIWEYPTIEELAEHLAMSDGDGDGGFDGGRSAHEADLDDPSTGTDTPGQLVAVVGLGCRLPGGVDDPESLWRLLIDGIDAVGPVPSTRWDAASVVDPDPEMPGTMLTPDGGFLANVSEFDADFFGISPREAEKMDPQQRLLAEVAWETCEDAGVPMSSLARTRTGVFVGISNNDYGRLQDREASDAYVATGNALSVAANRLSYLFDLRGPSLAIDTACSAALVAIHTAASAVARGEIPTAIAGGANLILTPDVSVAFTKMGALSPDGRCRPFDARGNGIVRSEGVVLFLLKPLSRALAERDRIYCVIRGGAVNHDGRTNGLMAPQPQAQEAVLRQAYASCGVDPTGVDYVEAHGTGTLLGDPIEAKALGSALGRGREPSRPLLLGSAKSNFGHTEAAAGAVGLAKTALMLHHRTLVPTVHYHAPNPHIPFDELRLRVVDTTTAWPRPGERAVAGVSAFGFGGTNAHLVLEEAPGGPERARGVETGTASPAGPLALVVSARSEQALRELLVKYRLLLAGTDDNDVPSLCDAALGRRDLQDHRVVCVGDTAAQLRSSVAAAAEGHDRPTIVRAAVHGSERHRAAFVFPGQSARYWPLSSSLWDLPGFGDKVADCARLLAKYEDVDLVALLRGPAEDVTLDDPALGQPAAVALQVALADVWQAGGIEPAAVIGHSLGEVSAAHVSGILTLEQAMFLAYQRGLAIRTIVGEGSMAVASVPRELVEEEISRLGLDRVWVAGVNGPATTLVSGDPAQVTRIMKALTGAGHFCRPIIEATSFASHCPMVTPAADLLQKAVADLEPAPGSILFISTITGSGSEGTRLDASYWRENLCHPVLFDTAMTTALQLGVDTVIEMAPRPLLVPAIRDRFAEAGQDGEVLASLRKQPEGAAALLLGLGELLCHGHDVDLARVTRSPDGAAHRELPRHPWHRHRHWIPEPRADRAVPPDAHPWLTRHIRVAGPRREQVWAAGVDLEANPYLADHRIDGLAVLPAAAIIDVFVSAARSALDRSDVAVTRVQLLRPTLVDQSTDQDTLQIHLTARDGRGTLKLCTRAGTDDEEGWVEAATAQYRVVEPTTVPEAALLDARARCRDRVDVPGYYQRLADAGVNYGPAFQGIRSASRGDDEGVAALRPLTDLLRSRAKHAIHPALLDSCLQVVGVAITGAESLRCAYLPTSVDRILIEEGAKLMWAHARVDDRPSPGADRDVLVADIVLFDRDGHQVGQLDGLRLQAVESHAAGDAIDAMLYDLSWEPASDSAPEETKPLAAGSWLVLTDRAGRAARIAERLQAAGQSVVLVDAARRPALPEVIGQMPDDFRGVLHAWSLDADLPEDAGEAEFWRSHDLAVTSLLHLTQALVATGRAQLPRLVILTRGTQAAIAGDAVRAGPGAGAWGLGRVIATEHHELDPWLIDLPTSALPAEASDVVALLSGTSTPDRQWAHRETGWLRAGLRPRREAPPAGVGSWARVSRSDLVPENFTLLAQTPGILSSLVPTVTNRPAPGAGQVEIEVEAAGLNFNDVLKAMNTCPGVEPGVNPLGAECAGRVVAVGVGVDDLHVGDHVMAVAPRSMSQYATTPATHVVPAPAGLTPAEAAACPIAFLTVTYGLEYLGHLAPGETILIHSATGGVGSAALQVARRNGARVLVTAGTPEKRAMLRDLGVEHVMDSRSLDFVAQVLDITDGRGVDVVLNFLTGDALLGGLSLLAENGRFVEIGKQDIYADSQIGLGALKRNRSFLAVDLERVISEQPRVLQSLLRGVTAGFERGEFHALPVTTFGYTQAEAGFALMARAQHLGKVVLCPDDPDEFAVRPADGAIRPDRTYLVTGGLSGLGLRTAEYLVDRGARHLALVGRRAPSPQAQARLAPWIADGVQVEVRSADVSDRREVVDLVTELTGAMPPMAGIFHAAGVLHDGVLVNLDRDAFVEVTAPKALGAWNLHQATASQPLEHFVLYSSAAALLGSPGQANYACANAMLDALALHRQGQGRPGLSIDWGPWSQIGLAARPDRGGSLAARGVLEISPDQGAMTLDRVLDHPGGQVCVLPLDGELLAQSAAAGIVPDLLRQVVGQGEPAPRPDGFAAQLLALPLGRARYNLLLKQCSALAAQVLKQDASLVDPQKPLAAMGFDSLMSLELRKRLETSLGISLSATVVWRFPTLAALVPFVAEQMGVELESREAGPAQGDQPGPGPELEAAELDVLSATELEALLLDTLQRYEGQ